MSRNGETDERSRQRRIEKKTKKRRGKCDQIIMIDEKKDRERERESRKQLCAKTGRNRRERKTVDESKKGMSCEQGKEDAK